MWGERFLDFLLSPRQQIFYGKVMGTTLAEYVNGQSAAGASDSGGRVPTETGSALGRCFCAVVLRAKLYLFLRTRNRRSPVFCLFCPPQVLSVGQRQRHFRQRFYPAFLV